MNKVGVEMDISNAYNFDTNDNNKILRKIVKEINYNETRV